MKNQTSMKNAAIALLKEINNGATYENIVTRLYYEQDEKTEYVQDFSYFANENYMSKELLNALGKGISLTSKQENELERFIIAKHMECAS